MPLDERVSSSKRLRQINYKQNKKAPKCAFEINPAFWFFTRPKAKIQPQLKVSFIFRILIMGTQERLGVNIHVDQVRNKFIANVHCKFNFSR